MSDHENAVPDRISALKRRVCETLRDYDGAKDLKAQHIRRLLRQSGTRHLSKRSVNRALHALHCDGAVRVRKVGKETHWSIVDDKDEGAGAGAHSPLPDSSSSHSSEEEESWERLWTGAVRLRGDERFVIFVDLGTCQDAAGSVFALSADPEYSVFYYGTCVMTKQLVVANFALDPTRVVCTPSSSKGAVLLKMAQDLGASSPGAARRPAFFLLSKNARRHALVENLPSEFGDAQCYDNFPALLGALSAKRGALE